MPSENISKSDLVPLYIGITGHRDIRDEDKPVLKQLIKNVLAAKQVQCPHTPVIMLTPLAEGADRLAAWAAVECGIPFICPLPMPVEEYKHDFRSPESLAEFEQLLKKADRWFELPLAGGKNVEELRENKELRDEQYFQIGFFIARHSQLLIALWDGVETNKRGGTAHIVNLKKNGIPTAHPRFQNRLKNLQTGPIHHILTPRKSHHLPENPFTEKMIFPEYHAEDENTGTMVDKNFLKHLDTYNQDIINLTSFLDEKIRLRENQPEIPPDGLFPADEPVTVARHLLISDSLATYFQKRRFFALRVLLILTVIAFMFFQVYAEFWHRPLLLILYPLTMGIGALWFLNANKRHFEQKHEDYRALAEAFRVQYFLGMVHQKTNVSEYYLQKHKGELEWVIYVLRSALFSIDPVRTATEPSDNITSERKIYRYVNDNWVSAQEDYYRKTSRKYERLHLRHHKTANRFFLGALSAAIFLFLASILTKFLRPYSEEYHELLQQILVVSTHSFLVIAAAIIGYSEKMVFSEQAKTCHQMSQLFAIAREKLGRSVEAGNFMEADAIIWELALESLMENADWLILHRSRPMEIPKG